MTAVKSWDIKLPSVWINIKGTVEHHNRSKCSAYSFIDLHQVYVQYKLLSEKRVDPVLRTYIMQATKLRIQILSNNEHSRITVIISWIEIFKIWRIWSVSALVMAT